MDKLEQIMTRYLLGELSEAEQSALEEKYFADPQVFDQVLKTESELVDNYVRGRLSAQERAHFERSYLAHPKRRERVKFAESLLTKLDGPEASGTDAARALDDVSGWHRLREALRAHRSALRFSIAFASLLIMLGGVWSLIESRRLRRELAQTQESQASHERREHELEQQVANERRRAEELTAELERSQRAQQMPQTLPSPPVSPAAPTFVTLLLTIGATRSSDTGPSQTLVIPPGTAEARFQLKLKEHDYSSYSLSLRRTGGEEVFNRGNLKPRTARSGATLILNVPASKFSTGDYMLTLRGVGPAGEVDDLSKTIFRVEKR